MELPERVAAAQPEDGGGGVVRGTRVFVEGQGVVLPHDAHLVGPVGLADLLHGGLDAAAERTLEVADLDDRDRRVVLAPDGVVGGDGDARGAVIEGGGAAALGADLDARPAIDAPHEEHAGDEAQQEPDDGGSFIHDVSPKFDLGFWWMKL